MSTVLIEGHGEPVAVIRLHRPERLNALNYEMASSLYDALDVVAGDDACKVVVLTGAGRGFCSGLDLKETGRPPEIGVHRHRHAGITGQGFMSNLTRRIQETPQIVIAAVNGPAYGGGLSLACACDLRIAAASARFCSAFIRTGMTGTDIGITYFLPRLIGAAHAFDLILTGREIGATEAGEIGLVSRVIGDEELPNEARTLAEQIARATSFGLRRTKEVMWHNLEASSPAAALALENRNQELAALDPEIMGRLDAYARRSVGDRR